MYLCFSLCQIITSNPGQLWLSLNMYLTTVICPAIIIYVTGYYINVFSCNVLLAELKLWDFCKLIIFYFDHILNMLYLFDPKTY